jgi:hypothetical protein
MGIESLDQKFLPQQQPEKSFEKTIDFAFAFQIRTLPDGQNAGHKYFLRAESDRDEQVAVLLKKLDQLSQIAADNTC